MKPKYNPNKLRRTIPIAYGKKITNPELAINELGNKLESEGYPKPKKIGIRSKGPGIRTVQKKKYELIIWLERNYHNPTNYDIYFLFAAYEKKDYKEWRRLGEEYLNKKEAEKKEKKKIERLIKDFFS